MVRVPLKCWEGSAEESEEEAIPSSDDSLLDLAVKPAQLSSEEYNCDFLGACTGVLGVTNRKPVPLKVLKYLWTALPVSVVSKVYLSFLFRNCVVPG